MKQTLLALLLVSFALPIQAAHATGPNDPLSGGDQIAFERLSDLGRPRRNLGSNGNMFSWRFTSANGQAECQLSLHTSNVIPEFSAAFPYEYGRTFTAVNDSEDNEHPNLRFQRAINFWMQTEHGDTLTLNCQRYSATAPAPFTLNEIRGIIGARRAKLRMATGTLASLHLPIRSTTATGETAVAVGPSSSERRIGASAPQPGSNDAPSARPPQAAI